MMPIVKTRAVIREGDAWPKHVVKNLGMEVVSANARNHILEKDSITASSNTIEHPPRVIFVRDMIGFLANSSQSVPETKGLVHLLSVELLSMEGVALTKK